MELNKDIYIEILKNKINLLTEENLVLNALLVQIQDSKTEQEGSLEMTERK